MFKPGIDRKPNSVFNSSKKYLMLFARLRPSVNTGSLIVHVQTLVLPETIPVLKVNVNTYNPHNKLDFYRALSVYENL